MSGPNGGGEAGGPRGQGGFAGFGARVVRHRWWVVAAWAVLLLGGTLLVPRFEEGLTGRWFPTWLDRVVPRLDLGEGEAGRGPAAPAARAEP